MKVRFGNLACILGAVLLSGCGGDLAGGPDNIDTLKPIVEDEVPIDGPRPPEDARVITSDGAALMDVAGNEVLLRGISLNYGEKPDTRVNGIAPIADLGSNIVRIVVDKDTTADQLRAALDAAMLNGVVAMVTLESPDKLMCVEDDSFFFEAVNTLWLGRWLPVLASAEYQSSLMINIASGWGPVNVWNSDSIGYDGYINDYKRAINRFRSAGFKVPLVIDAAHCGEDFNTFLGSRGKELLVADPASNLVISIHAFGTRWGSRTSLNYAMNQLSQEGLPIIVSEFGDSSAVSQSIDHLTLIEQAEGGMATIFNFPWSSSEDVVGYSYPLESALDFTGGGAIVFDIFIDSAYKVDGNLAYQAFLIDSNDRYASLGFNTVTGFQANAWNTINLEIVENMSNDAFGYADEGFDLSSVAKVGFEVAANGKPVDVTGEIRFDNLIVGLNDDDLSNVTALYQADFTGDEGWAWTYGAGDESVVYQDSGVLNILAPWSNQDSVSQVTQAAVCDAQKLSGIDLTSPILLSVDVKVPAEYTGASGFIQFMFNDSAFKFASFGRASFSTFQPGVWKTVTFAVSDFNAEYVSSGFDTLSPPGCVGVNIGDMNAAKTAPIQLDNFKILPMPEPPAKQTIYEATFKYSEGWKRTYGAGDSSSVYQYEEGLAILPEWGGEFDGIIVGYDGTANIRPAIDLQRKITFSMDVMVPSEYQGESVFVQFALNDDSYANSAFFGFTNTFNYDDWTTVSFTLTDIKEQAGYIDNKETFIVDKIPQVIGMQVGNVSSPKDNPILIDNFRMVQETGVILPENLVVDLGFEKQADVDALMIEYVRGPSWTESALSGAKQFGIGVNPFSWVAQAWFGQTGTDEAFNISSTEDSATLTERGQEIVNSAKGIANTADTVSFE